MTQFMKKYLPLLLLPLVLGAATPTLAGSNVTGGGDVIACGWWIGAQDNPPAWLVRIDNVYLADIYQLASEGRLNSLKGLTEWDILNRFTAGLNAAEEGLGDRLRQEMSQLQFIPVDQLPELDDDNIDVNSTGCGKKQLAVQDISKKTVRYHKKFYSYLSNAERVFFMVHETLIARRRYVGDTTPARDDLRKLISRSGILGSFETRVSLTPEQLVRLESLYREEVRTKYLQEGLPFFSHPKYGTAKEIPWSEDFDGANLTIGYHQLNSRLEEAGFPLLYKQQYENIYRECAKFRYVTLRCSFQELIKQVEARLQPGV